MRLPLLLFTFLLATIRLFAQQNVAYKYGIDTGQHTSASCPDSSNIPYPYFSVKGKYPMASSTLRQQADAALSVSGYNSHESGFVTFRMLRDCKGQAVAWRLLLTDDQYAAATFTKELVLPLYHYVASLPAWPVRNYKGAPVSYWSYLTFKIENGHVAQVAP